MPISADFQNKLNYIIETNPEQYDFVLTKKNQLVRQKVTFVHNFIRWFIHLITCKRFPLNEKLDKAALYILKEAQNLTEAERKQEKALLSNAFKTLLEISNKNGGSKSHEIDGFLQTINKIENLDVVQNLRKENKDLQPLPPVKTEDKEPTQPQNPPKQKVPEVKPAGAQPEVPKPEEKPPVKNQNQDKEEEPLEGVRKVNDYLQKGQLEEARKALANLTSEELEQAVPEVAREFYRKGKFNEGRTVLDRLPSSVIPICEEFCLLYCQKGEYGNAKKSAGSHIISSRVFSNVANDYLDNGNVEKAFEVATQEDIIVEQEFFINLSEACIQQEKYELAEKALTDGRVFNQDKQDELYGILADKYFEKGLLEKALKMTEKLSGEKGQERFCKISKAYFQQDNYEKAANILDSLVIDPDFTHPLYKEFALATCRSGKYNQSIKFINAIEEDQKAINRGVKDRTKKEIFDTIAEEHLQKKDYASAKVLYITIAKEYKRENDKEEAFRVLNLLANENFIDLHDRTKIQERIEAEDFDNAIGFIEQSHPNAH